MLLEKGYEAWGTNTAWNSVYIASVGPRIAINLCQNVWYYQHESACIVHYSSFEVYYDVYTMLFWIFYLHGFFCSLSNWKYKLFRYCKWIVLDTTEFQAKHDLLISDMEFSWFDMCAFCLVYDVLLVVHNAQRKILKEKKKGRTITDLWVIS